jgi:hypothetical protein
MITAAQRWRQNHPEEARAAAARYRIKNREKCNAAVAKCWKEDPEKCRQANAAAQKKWSASNRAWRREYIKSYRKTNPLFALSSNLRGRCIAAFKDIGWKKSKSTLELLGADLPTIKSWIETKFQEGMSWNNYGNWHIDHIIPLASAKTEKDLIRLFYYTNLQPLWAVDNQRKGDRII